MASDNNDSKTRRRRLIGAGIRTLSRGALRTMPGYDRAKSWHKTGQDWYDTLGGMKGAAMKLGQIASQYEDVGGLRDTWRAIGEQVGMRVGLPKGRQAEGFTKF